MIEEIVIKDIIFDPTLQVRNTIYPQRVEYLLDVMEAKGHIPPILVAKDTQGYILIDGWHRIEAARRLNWTKIEAKVENIPEEQRLTRAWKANDKSPMPPTRQERNDYIIRLAQMGWKQEEIAKEVGLTRPRVAQIVGNVNINIPDTRRLKPSDRMEALRHFLQRQTHQAIAEEFHVARSTISDALSKLIREITGLYKSGKHKWEVAEQYGLDEDEVDKILARDGDPLNFPLPLDTWWPAFHLSDEQQNYPGVTPINLVKCILALFTKPGAHIVDPMAGSGTTGLACRDMVSRTCELFDIAPIDNPLHPIKPHNIKGEGLTPTLPPVNKKPDLVFLDPPYSQVAEGKYPEEDLSKLSPRDFRLFMYRLFREIRQAWSPCRVVVLMSSLNRDTRAGRIEDNPSYLAAYLSSKGFRPLEHIVNQIGNPTSHSLLWKSRAEKGRWLLRGHIHIFVTETV